MMYLIIYLSKIKTSMIVLIWCKLRWHICFFPLCCDKNLSFNFLQGWESLEKTICDLDITHEKLKSFMQFFLHRSAVLWRMCWVYLVMPLQKKEQFCIDNLRVYWRGNVSNLSHCKPNRCMHKNGTDT